MATVKYMQKYLFFKIFFVLYFFQATMYFFHTDMDAQINTGKSRFNGFQGTGDNHLLLLKSVIAKMTIEDYFLKKKGPLFQSHESSKIVLLYFLCCLLKIRPLNATFCLPKILKNIHSPPGLLKNPKFWKNP